MDDGPPVSFIGRPLSRAFETRLIEMAPGAVLPYDTTEWHDALVVVEAGAIEVEGALGTRRTFGPGDVLCLERFPCRLLRNRGADPAVLSVVWRRRKPG